MRPFWWWLILGSVVLALLGVVTLEMMGMFATYTHRMRRLTAIQSHPENLEPGGLEGVPLVMYINMDKSHERRKLMEDQLRVLASRETEVRRVRGVKYDAQTRPLTHSNTLRNSERGVIQAHYDAIQMALDEQVPFAMILEDDASFHLSKAWPESIRSLVARAPAGWDVIRLYGFQSLAFANCGHSVQFQQPALDVHSAAAYLISRQGMLKVQQGTDNFQSTFLHRSEPIDFSVVNTRKEMNNYILDKLYIAPFTHTASTLQDSINARWQLHCIDAALRHFVFRDPWMPVSKLNFQPK